MTLPQTNRRWHLTGKGFENLSLCERERPRIGPEELLLAQRCVTICYSSIKVLKQGSDHPRLAGRDLRAEPIILGDECFGVVEEVGERLRDRFASGECVVVSPDLGVVAYGYGIDGGLQQFNAVRGPLLDFLLKVPREAVDRVGMFALSLSEPLACVERGLALEYRSAPKEDGRCLAWADASAKGFSLAGVDVPRQVLLFEPRGPAQAMRHALAERDIRFTHADDLGRIEGNFDDIFVLSDDPRALAEAVAWGERRLNDFGMLALLGDPKEGDVAIDIGLAHYARTLIVGSDRRDVRDAYTRTTAFGLRRGMRMLLFGAGGPMGQIFLIRCAQERERRPTRIDALEIRPDRLDKLSRMRTWMHAEDLINVVDNRDDGCASIPANGGRASIPACRTNGGAGIPACPEEIDHAVLLCDDMAAFQPVVDRMAEGGIVNAFAGLKGRSVRVRLNDLCARGVRVVGHSGVTLDIHRRTLERVVAGEVDLAPVVAAVGGFDAARDGLMAADARALPGKTVIYTDVEMPVTPIGEFTGGGPWSAEAEQELLRTRVGKSEV